MPRNSTEQTTSAAMETATDHCAPRADAVTSPTAIHRLASPPVVPPPALLGKAPEVPPVKRKRNPIKEGASRVLNCNNCRDKKMRCDRCDPCANCLLRDTPCVWPEGANPKSNDAGPSRLSLNILEINRLRREVATLVSHLRISKKTLDDLNVKAGEWVRVEKAKARASGNADFITGQYAFGALISTTAPKKATKKKKEVDAGAAPPRPLKKLKLDPIVAPLANLPPNLIPIPDPPQEIPYIAAFDPHPPPHASTSSPTSPNAPLHPLPRPIRPARPKMIPWRVWAADNLPPLAFEEPNPVLRGGDSTVTTIYPTPRPRSTDPDREIQLVEGGARRSYTHAFPQTYPNPFAVPISPPISSTSATRSGSDDASPPFMHVVMGFSVGLGIGRGSDDSSGEGGGATTRKGKLPSIRRWFPAPELMLPVQGPSMGFGRDEQGDGMAV